MRPEAGRHAAMRRSNIPAPRSIPTSLASNLLHRTGTKAALPPQLSVMRPERPLFDIDQAWSDRGGVAVDRGDEREKRRSRAPGAPGHDALQWNGRAENPSPDLAPISRFPAEQDIPVNSVRRHSIPSKRNQSLRRPMLRWTFWA